MVKVVKVLCDPELKFSIHDEVVRAGDLTVDQAELIDTQYPGQYVQVVVDSKPVKAVAEAEKK